ncbi:urease accessory protein UreD [Actinophytocola xanthii]|uniref:Urease accessory protein UreD n=1 Tax=Actinophytocola xanthii TaxID=1912961 RepID=A0A1Q8CU06_9PSEU|nr:urease accessory protein UreD [Actinophytocola xanthii]OLF17841.1 urease accessory protein [Actinophytocola xanthii]
MRARAHLRVERDGAGRHVVRELRSAAPLTLLPARTNGTALVHLVSSAATPLGGDDLALTVEVGPHAELTLVGVAATVALPGPHGAPSRSSVRLTLAPGASVAYLPEPTVVTGRACHESVLVAELAGNATLRAREVLVLGRVGERPGTLTTAVTASRDARPLVRQHLRVGDRELDASVASLAGKRVLATELYLDGSTPAAASGEWWSCTPLAAGGTLTTALADDAVTAVRRLGLAAAARG